MGRGPKACWMGRRGRRGGGGESLHAHKPGGFQRILTQRVSDEAGGPAWQRDASQGLETPSLGFCPHRLSPTLDLGRASIPTITTILYWGPNSVPAPEPGTRLCDTTTPHRPCLPILQTRRPRLRHQDLAPKAAQPDRSRAHRGPISSCWIYPGH